MTDEPLTGPPAEPEGDDQVAGGGRTAEPLTEDDLTELEDELDDDDIDDEAADDAPHI